MAVSGRSPDAILRTFSQGVGALVALASFLAVLGEAIALSPLLHALRMVPIHPNQQALVAMLLGVSLFLQHLKSPWGQRFSRALALAATVFCLLAIAELVLGWDLGFARMRFPRGLGSLSGLEFQRLSLPSAIELTMLGLALWFGDRHKGLPSDSLTLTTLGYLFITALIVGLHIQNLYGTAFTLPVGVLLILALALGVLCSHPDRGVLKALSRQTPVGVVLRRLIPTALLTPMLIGLAWIEGLRLGLFEAPQGMFFAVLAMTIVSLAIVGWNVSPLQRLENAREEAVMALQASEAYARRLAAIVEASEDAITTYEPKTLSITFWSRGAEKVWGWGPEEALGKPAGFLVFPEARESVRAMLGALREGAPTAVLEGEGLRKDGKRIDVSMSGFPIRDPQGRLVALASIQRDITESKRAMAEMARRTAELHEAEELNRLKDHFLSTISHEMKTPLSLITGYVELLEETYPDEPLVAGIKDGSQRLTEHIDNILDYSALISGSLPLYKTEIDLGELSQHVEEIFRGRIAQKGITLSVEVAPGTPVIAGDFRRLSQILLELLKNAVKFTPPEGRIAIRIAPTEEGVRMDVWNSGEGIPEKDFARIWQAFSQLATQDAFRKGGLGLGLTIVKKLVELHEGKVSVASQLGEGTTFTVYLPRGTPGRPEASGAAPEGRETR